MYIIMGNDTLVSVDDIRRHEQRENKSVDDFNDWDWKVVRSIVRIRDTMEAFQKEREKKRIVVLDVYEGMDLMNRPQRVSKQPTPRAKKKSPMTRRAIRENGTCPVRKRDGQICGKALKTGYYICGKHKLPTDVPYKDPQTTQ